MVRRVKAYLNNMKIITDEDRLHAMSLECEVPAGGIPTQIHTHAVSQQSVSKNGRRRKLGSFLYVYVRVDVLGVHNCDSSIKTHLQPLSIYVYNKCDSANLGSPSISNNFPVCPFSSYGSAILVPPLQP